ncbi:hypothetical protein [Mesomycoplasma bovoculi]|uniref:Putative phase variable surface protein VpbE n=1 Tax=Mesomycoplasma bovoculi M165/69 TaxID=743966 RepID=W5UU80_9BACT|nr:hypothetical protein [Mesomycoplasma bovoculi]AHH45365.1 putative phase variable surface protein VpbE [Mesomycoplasma bovoculi M165/69]
MTKKSKLIIAGSTVLAGSIIIAIAVPLSQKANQPTPEQKQEQQQDDDSKKTGENSGQVETNKQQDDLQKANQPTPEQKQEQEKTPPLTEENKGQVDSQKDSTKEKQKDGAESASGEDNKAAQPMKSQVDSKNNGTENQQNGPEVSGKVEKHDTIESIKQKGTELQSQLTPVNLYFRDKYFFLRLQTSKTTYDKIKNDRLKFVLEKGLREYIEQAAEVEQNHQTSYYLNYLDEHNGNVSFEITSDQSYGGNDEKGTYKVTKVWLSKDPSETNLLKKDSKTVKVQ